MVHNRFEIGAILLFLCTFGRYESFRCIRYFSFCLIRILLRDLWLWFPASDYYPDY